MPETFERHTISFVVRLWTEGPQHSSELRWRGQIEHVGSGETAYFQVPEAMLALLGAHLKPGMFAPDARPVPIAVEPQPDSDI